MNLELGFYGKLPSLGDFASRRLSQDFIQPWDGWVQSSLATSKELLAEQWLKCYLTSPIWRFALSPGLCGKDAWLGIVMPSVDRVGRYFPLTIACKVPRNYSLINLFAEANDWFYEVETVALSALQNDLLVEDFDRMVQGIGGFSVKHPHQINADFSQNCSTPASVFYLEFNNEVSEVEDIYPQLSSLLLDSYAEGYSLWSTVGSEAIKPGCLVLKGMPACTVYKGLITGQFQQQDWNLHQQFVEQLEPVTVLKESNPELEKSQLSAAEKPVEELAVNAIFSSPEQRNSVQSSWRSFSKTDKGNIRRLNEDAILDRPDLGLWVVADGMGGHQAGDLASRKIIHALNKLSGEHDLEASLTHVKSAIHSVNNELRRIAENSFEQQIIGSTIVTLVAGKDYFAYLWAGDSRLYRLRDKKLVQLTEDHCEQDEEPDGLLLGNDLTMGLKQNNVITRAVGAFDELELDCKVIEIKKGDLFLLSSDGLDKEMTFDEIELVLNDNVYSDSVELLLETVLTRKGRDNISIIVVEISEGLRV
ncbi:MAG: type VI secretion system-associated protein TagF [Methylococcaceae bacterium]|nr:type VI secretion system-associated protein TagF [Methylococcaceae bacterium]